MKECLERVVKVGFLRKPRAVFDEIEMVTAEMIRNGWILTDSCLEDGIANVHLLFERTIDTKLESTQKM